MWEAYGDANPLEHGGIWVKKVDSNCYDIIKYTPELDEIQNLQVDTADCWIEREAIMSYLGMTNKDFDDIHFAIGCTDYYSSLNFGYAESVSKENVVEELKEYGIKMEE